MSLIKKLRLFGIGIKQEIELKIIEEKEPETVEKIIGRINNLYKTTPSKTPSSPPPSAPPAPPKLKPAPPGERVPAVMQEIYKKVLLDNKPIRVLKERDGIYTVAISNGLGPNTLYLLTPEGVRKRPLTYKDRDLMLTQNHVTVRRIG